MSTSTADPVAARWTVAILTVVVFAAVVFVMGGAPPRSHVGPAPLATLNALLNAGASVALLTGYAFIRKRRVQAHRNCMVAAFCMSSLFLVTYLVHHAQVGSVRFEGQGWTRGLYFALLIPHVVLAGVIVPLALFTLYRGWTGRIARHRAIARYTLPLWLYVSVSGVLIYWMLYH